MAKKAVEQKHELIKFIKSLYTDEIQLNFDDYFEITWNDSDQLFHLSFPSNRFYKIEGNIDLDQCPSLRDWLKIKNSSVRFDKVLLDEFRKRTLKDFDSIEINDDSYVIVFIDGNQYKLERESTDHNFIGKENFIERIPAINSKVFLNPIFDVYYNTDNGYVVTRESGTDELIFDSPVKNFKIIFKKEADYKFYSTEKENGFRFVMLEAKGTICQLRQYFKVI